MMKTTTLFGLLCFLAFSSLIKAQDTLIIQEDTVFSGICTMDGIIDSAVSCYGYTGIGYVDINSALNIGISYSIKIDTSGMYDISMRYALNSGNRDGALYIDYIRIDTIEFPSTGFWNSYQMSDAVSVYMDSGVHAIRITSLATNGLPNLDYFRVIGDDSIHVAECEPAYTFDIDVNIAEAGSVSYTPIQEFYLVGTEITVSVDTTYPDYFFHSWSGEAADDSTVCTFAISQNTHLTALFYPDNVPAMDLNAMGYATVQHDNGTPYLLIGGALGDTVYARTLDDLHTYLGDNTPRVVIFNQYIYGSDEVTVLSNKTLIGTEGAHLEGIKLGIENARNVIIKNLTLSKVLAADAIEITGSQNIWIDHCDLYSDRLHDAPEFEDYYDGLIDIKNQAKFLTISNCYLHHHRKTSLISSGDQEIPDTVIRITYYSNYFDSCGARLPSIRFGKAHVLNNYYKNCETAINSRMGACVRVEGNYFVGVGTAVFMDYSEYGGSVELINNHFGSSSVTTTPTCELNVPYEYDDFLIDVEQVPDSVSAQAGIDTTLKFNIPDGLNEIIASNYELYCYPNPVKNSVTISFYMEENIKGSLTICDMVGHVIKEIGQHTFNAGVNRIEVNLSDHKPGLYLYQLKTKKGYGVNRLIIQR